MPAALEELLNIPDYAIFNLAVENVPHLSIPRGVHGDFATVTAPGGNPSSSSLLLFLPKWNLWRLCN